MSEKGRQAGIPHEIQQYPLHRRAGSANAWHMREMLWVFLILLFFSWFRTALSFQNSHKVTKSGFQAWTSLLLLGLWIHCSDSDSTAALTGPQKTAENVSSLDFCNNREATTGVLTPAGDKKPAKHFLRTARCSFTWKLLSYEKHIYIYIYYNTPQHNLQPPNK